ncbi:MAG: hypothetical protein M3119_11865 [Verrucomicrobiota bacterium]|nr:hypothetical protein [Verrucomicrobiota bacterium]MDQ6940840.1 hypothetical protein [Verrucomicrobiota bacterium]
MSEPELKPEDVPLLFPDPVIEYYLAKVDRAAIREQLKKTPGERLEWLQQKMNREREENSVVGEEPPPWPAKKSEIDMGVDPAWFAEAKAVPLLFPDPVIEAYLQDVDRGLIRQALKLSVAERFERFHRLMQGAYELRRACAKRTFDR